MTALVVRYSAIPTHSESSLRFSYATLGLKPDTVITAVFAITGVTFRIFALTLVLSLPRQLVGVQIGGTCLSFRISYGTNTFTVLTLQTYQGNETTKQDKTLSRIIIAITVVITILAMGHVIFLFSCNQSS